MRSVQELADAIIDNSLIVQASLRLRYPLGGEARRRRTEAIAKIKAAVKEVTEQGQNNALVAALDKLHYGKDRVGLSGAVLEHLRGQQ